MWRCLGEAAQQQGLSFATKLSEIQVCGNSITPKSSRGNSWQLWLLTQREAKIRDLLKGKAFN